MDFTSICVLGKNKIELKSSFISAENYGMKYKKYAEKIFYVFDSSNLAWKLRDSRKVLFFLNSLQFWKYWYTPFDIFIKGRFLFD